MRVSIVIPLFNKARHIRRCLESIAAQTFTDFEAIIVDDGSTDESRGIAASFPDPRFRVVSQPNAGPGAARNRGAALASGRMLAFSDADDEWLPDYLARNVQRLDQAGDGVAAVSSGHVEDPGGINRESFWQRRGLKEGVFSATPGTSPQLLIYTLAYMRCGNTVIRTDVFRRLGGFYDRGRALYAEDAWLWMQVLLNSTVWIGFEPLTRFHIEASELSANLRGARPVEPFLIEPEPLWNTCPPHLRGLLRDVLASRALKTACVLGFWGQWREANALRRKFSRWSDFRLPYFWPAVGCCTPLAGALGAISRWLARPRRTRPSRAMP
jgi:glycosyltransferase involved in cell wall biosynthesis